MMFTHLKLSKWLVEMTIALLLINPQRKEYMQTKECSYLIRM